MAGTKSTRVPRTRGDGPRRARAAARETSGSPHTRGWTRASSSRRRAMRGFPAHAGMDPNRHDPAPGGDGVPRTRGDGPRAAMAEIGRRTGSPHTRGWTPAVGRGPRQGEGFPAHAGMDLRVMSVSRARRGVPRTRGDGPWISATSSCPCRGSPHTRGWTRRGVAAPARRRGFPAHAGMDPHRIVDFLSFPRVPRTRGDGPLAGQRGRHRPGGSPHTRGWTAPVDLFEVGGCGFPAHAGMDRWSPPRRDTAAGVPRTRGDGPFSSASTSFPRAGSPHTRGWTVGPYLPGIVAVGFPAHAGMDPS